MSERPDHLKYPERRPPSAVEQLNGHADKLEHIKELYMLPKDIVDGNARLCMYKLYSGVADFIGSPGYLELSSLANAVAPDGHTASEDEPPLSGAFLDGCTFGSVVAKAQFGEGYSHKLALSVWMDDAAFASCETHIDVKDKVLSRAEMGEKIAKSYRGIIYAITVGTKQYGVDSGAYFKMGFSYTMFCIWRAIHMIDQSEMKSIAKTIEDLETVDIVQVQDFMNAQW